MVKIRFILSIVLSIFLCLELSSQDERGVLPIYNYSPKDYNALPQNWAIIQDSRGIIYIANNQGLLEFNGNLTSGAAWKLFKVDNTTNIRAIDIDKYGYIHIGANNEFGYFSPDTLNKGKFIYHNLKKKLKKNFDFRDVWYVVAVDNEVYYATNDGEIFYWNRENIDVIKLNQKIRHLFKMDDRVFVSADSVGIAELKSGEITKIRGGEKILVEKDGELKSDFSAFMQVSSNQGLFISHSDYLKRISLENNSIKITKFKTELDKVFENNSPSKIVKINENKFAVSCKLNGGGIFIINDKGELLNLINDENGLQNIYINDIYVDNQNFIWAALNNGISRIKVNSLYERFDEEVANFGGTIEDIKRFNDFIYLASHYGLYKLDQNTEEISTYINSEKLSESVVSKFTKIEDENLKTSIWSLLSFKTNNKSLLLIATNNSIGFIDENDNFTEIAKTYPWGFFQDNKDPNRVYVGTDPGLMSIYFENGSFKVEKVFENIKYSIRFIVQDKQHNLWCGINDGGLLFIKDPSEFCLDSISQLQTKFYGEENNLPSGPILPDFYNESLILATGEGIFEYNQSKDTFYHTDYLGDWFSDGKHAVHRLDIDNLDNIWSITFSEDGNFTFVTKSTRLMDDDEPFITQKLLVDEKELLHTIFSDKNGVVWVAGTNGVYKLNWKGETDEKLPFKTYINSIIAGEDTVFNGVFYDENKFVVNTQQPNLYPIITYKNNNISFDFSAIGFNYESNLTYSWKLENFDEDWSLWESKSEERYTNLHEGKYIFHVKAKDVYGNISEIASYSFTVKPPWYRTILAYILYVLFFIFFVWAAITISTNSLRKIIKEATAKIQKQKDDIEEKNKNIMDSIKYAQRIQEAVLPSEAKLRKYFPEHFVLFKPRDIVSGDFYWMMNKGDKTIIVAADCTGHGVPGAFMSIMGVSFLNEIANKKEVQTAAEVLNQLRANIINSLNTDEGENKAKDGMDISICVYDFKEMTMQFSGAYNHLYFVRDGKFDKIKADRMPVGVHERDGNDFTNKVFDIQKDDVYYILSDGLIDQFGGPDGKKYMTKRFKQLIMDIYDKPMPEQKRTIEEEHIKWRGELEQIDDIILIGIKVV